jgi:hypothetical protein
MNFRISKKWLWIGAGIITAVFVTAFLIFYYFFKTDYTPYGFYNVLINYLVLIGITVWSVGILYRLQQRTSWKLFLAVVFLVQGWLISSILKWTAEPGTGFARFMTYVSYIPLLFIPVLWLCLFAVSFTRIHVWKLLAVFGGVATVLSIMILTNDFHHWAFYWDSNGATHHGALYFLTYDFVILCVFTAVIIFIYGTINKRNGLREILPVIIAVALTFGYSITYLILEIKNRLDLIGFAENYYAVYSLCIFVTSEICLQTGLVQNNGAYARFFKYGPYRLALTTRDFRIIYANNNFTMNEDIVNETRVVKDGFRYSKKDVSHGAGYLIVEDDIRDILRLQGILLEREKEAKRTNALLRNSQAAQKEMAKAETRERLNESVYSEIAAESDNIKKIVNALPDELTPETRAKYLPELTELKIRLTFLKQRCLLLINGAGEGVVTYPDFTISMGSLKLDLQSLGFITAVSYRSEDALPLDFVLAVNAFFHSVIVAFGEERGMVLLNLDPASGSFKARISGADHFNRAIVTSYSKVTTEDEDIIYTYQPKRGGKKHG